MKRTSLFAIVLLALTSHAFAATQNFTCKGVYENKGANLKLKVYGNKYSLAGTTMKVDGEDDKNFLPKVNCSGDLHRTVGKYDIYTSDSAHECGVDYVKIMNTLCTDGSGMLTLARTSGGDNHDYSGYTYRNYHCDQNN